MKMKRLAALLLLPYATLCIITGILVADGSLHPARRPLDAGEQAQAVQAAKQAGSNVQDVSLAMPDGANLKAWLIQPAKANGNAVILLHGLGDNRGGVIGYAQLLLSAGYSVLMPDARAQGESGGQLATYGLVERQDIHQWITWLQDRTHPQCIFGFGESMGAAQLLESLAVEGRFCAVAAESPFSDFREIAYDRMGHTFGVGPWLGETLLRPVVEVAFLRAQQKYGLHISRFPQSKR
jgi:predicted alpha/beta-fold hydrolase